MNNVQENKTKNKYAIFFGLTDDYTFAAANVLMGLKQYSFDLMRTCDVIVYHNGVSEKHKAILSTIHNDIYFHEFILPDSWSEIAKHRTPAQWGTIVLSKFLILELVKTYEKVLLLDADMLIRGDISDLFEIEEDIAWRNVIAWDPNKHFSSLLFNPNDTISVCNGGLMLFSNKISKYNVDNDSILQAYEKTKDIARGGIDETLLAWIVYSKGMSVKKLDVDIYNTPARDLKPETKIVHFLIYKSIQTKPWKNLAAYLYFKDWVENYKHWLEMGGEDVIHFGEEDYYKLFAYDKEKEIADLKNRMKKELDKKQKGLEAIKQSVSWKITAPFRKIMKNIKKIMK